MAYAGVVSLMQILQQIGDPGCCVPHKKQQIQSLQEKVSFLHDFLEKYYVYTDKVVKDLEIKIRDTAYRAEDIIESYVSDPVLYRTNWMRYLTSCLACICDRGDGIGGFETFCRDLDGIIEETHSIQQEAMDIKRMLDLNYVQQRKSALPVDRSRLTLTDKSPTLVGLAEDKDKIKDWLTSSSSKLEVISIVGMGGIGKTTFARNLFDDTLIAYHFHSRAWVTISLEYQMHEILLGLLDSTTKLGLEMREECNEELAERLYKSLKGKTYLIVMDDVWDTQVWDEVKRIFPDDNNGSRIVLTTRLANVGGQGASTGYLHDMSFLSSSESWNLFCEKAFGGECCPPCLEGIGQGMMRNCRGLPLSIVVVAGMLSMDKTVSYWETIATALNSILAKDGGQCSTIFSLSYNHLPAHLKPCFLYFAIFPEDYVIRRSNLIKLWVAEGFIKPMESKSLEDIADECLEDLLNRSLIMVLKLRRDGKVKTYIIHDLLRDFCITQAQKEKFLRIPNGYTPAHPEGIRSERRLSIQPSIPLKSIKYIFNPNGPPLPTRSLLFYYPYPYIIISKHNFGLLRVLDMRSGKWLTKFPKEVVRLVHLRYFSLLCWNLVVPASISSLRGLQTLVIDSIGDFTHLPLEVWTMLHLRHVQIRNTSCGLPNPPNSDLVILANLQTLCEMRNFRFTDDIIKRIPNLKKLGVCYDKGIKDWSQYHLSNIVCFKELESLYLHSYSRIAFPPNFKFPAALKKLTLSRGSLRWKDLSMVGSLPNLQVLVLKFNACRGAVWNPKEGEFRELIFLRLHDLSNLVHWNADSCHFPKLKCLQITWCSKLKEIPVEMGNIQTLEKIELDRASPSALASAELILDEQRSFGNDFLQLLLQ